MTNKSKKVLHVQMKLAINGAWLGRNPKQSTPIGYDARCVHEYSPATQQTDHNGWRWEAVSLEVSMTVIPSTIRNQLAILSCSILLLASCVCHAQSLPGNVPQSVGNYAVVQRGPYSRVWQSTLLYTNANGDVTTNQQSYTELATGICYLTNSEYVDSVEQVELAPGGAQAVQGRHQVQWTANANTPGGAVTVTTPDGKQLSSSVFGLAYYDVATGSNAAIGHLKDCNGSIVEPNQVLYEDAFSNVTADISYSYTMAGLSQDIVLRQNLLPPDNYGLSDETTILQIYTRFFNFPEPAITSVTNGNDVDAEILDFGDMKMAMGQAFFVNGQAAPVAAGMVSKQWVQINNGTYLVESIPYSTISNQLQQLPHASNIRPSLGGVRRLAFLESKPSWLTGFPKGGEPMKIARAKSGQPRLKLDYELLSTSTNLVLQGDTTYLVTNLVNVSGTTTIEGGTVVKFATNGTASITATNVVCLTGPYSPGVFTSINDNSVGDPIGTGVAVRGAANYLNFGSLGTNSLVFRNLRFSYANLGIYGALNSLNSNSITIWDCQFVNCAYGFSANPVNYTGPAGGFPINLYNVLFVGCGTGVAGTDSGSACIGGSTRTPGRAKPAFIQRIPMDCFQATVTAATRYPRRA
jgi:hypothetical protein